MLTTEITGTMTADNLPLFFFDKHQVRTLLSGNNEPWFVAMDVAEILAYNDTEAMTRRLDDDEKQTRQIVGFGNRGITIINEAGLYSAIIGSSKVEAKAFKRWVTHEVLPTIRRTGKYEVAPAPAELSRFQILELAMESERERLALAEQLAAAAPAIEFVSKFVDATGLKGFREVAKLLKVKENEFSDFLIEREIMYRLAGRLTPYAPHLDAGRFKVTAGVTKEDRAFSSAKFTAKGIDWVAGELARWQLKQKEGQHA